MTDFRFDNIVNTTKLIGPQGQCFKSTCLTCSKQYRVTRYEFELEAILDNDLTYIPSSVTEDMLEYVSKMRAWNCCHEGETPIDGLLEEMNAPTGVRFE